MSLKNAMVLFSVLLALGCRKPVERAREVAERIEDRFETTVPLGERPTREEIEHERFNEEWRRLQSFRVERIRRALAAEEAALPVVFTPVPVFSEKLEGAPFSAIDTLPVQVPIRGDVGGPSVLRAQVLLDRVNFSVGVIDGRWGKNSAIAVYWFQQQNGLEPTGEIDEATFRALLRAAGSLPTLAQHTLGADDFRGPFTAIPDDMYEKAELKCLCYESPTEKLAERFHTTPELLQTINPSVDFDALREGQALRVPNVRKPVGDGAPRDIRRVVVSVEGWYLHAFDEMGNIVFHAPTTLGSQYDPSPNETVKIASIHFNPHFHYQPKLFSEVPDTDPEARLKPGPNSPVGVVWAALSKPHFGIHGTAEPDTIGYTTSHGCVRLTNWDVHDFAHRAREGITVEFVDTRKG